MIWLYDKIFGRFCRRKGRFRGRGIETLAPGPAIAGGWVPFGLLLEALVELCLNCSSKLITLCSADSIAMLLPLRSSSKAFCILDSSSSFSASRLAALLDICKWIHLWFSECFLQLLYICALEIARQNLVSFVLKSKSMLNRRIMQQALRLESNCKF